MRKPYIMLVVVLVAFSLVHLSIHSFAEMKTYTVTVKQPFGGSQAPDDARTAAIAKAKREVLEKAGTYLESLTIIKNNMVEKDKILALAAGVLKAEIISQENYSTKDSFGIIIEARVKIDTSILEERINKLLGDDERFEKYQESQKREKDLLARIAVLEKQNQKYKKLSTKTLEKEKLEKEFSKTAQELSAVKWRNKALDLWEDGKYSDPDKALNYLNKAIKLDPKYARAYNNRGNAWITKSEYDRAISNFNKAIELKPKYAKAYTNRGIAWRKKGKYGEAISDFNKAIKLKPNYTKAYNNRGKTWRKKGKYGKAISDYSKTIEIDPKHAKAHYNRGLVWQKKGMKQKAVDDFNSYLRIAGNKYGDAQNVRRIIRKLGYTPKY